jgi:uncharacterized protein (DUF1015 family)
MDVSAFKGYRYDAAVVGDPGRCVSPPYDVIDDAQQDHLYNVSPYNIVRVIRGKADGDGQIGADVYQRAATWLKQWRQQGVLRQEESELMYAYVQDFSMHGHAIRRSGLVALGRLEPYGGAVRPHENTLSGPKADRLRLLQATRTQIGQIFMLYDDPNKRIDAILDRVANSEPLLRHEDDAGVIHRLFPIRDPNDIATVQAVMKGRDGFIADGHHRYETALAYWQETGEEAAHWQLMTFVNTHNEGMLVLPTHRLVFGLGELHVPGLIRAMEADFDIARLAFETEEGKLGREEELFSLLAIEFEQGSHAIGMYFGEGAFYLATLRDLAAMAAIAPDRSDAWRQLDVAILHRLMLEKHLGIDEAALAEQRHVRYVKDLGLARADAIAQVDRGDAHGVFFLNPTRPEEVQAVAQAGERMPQKSTFFFPKVFSGLVLRMLD